jgi:hypothetical protein
MVGGGSRHALPLLVVWEAEALMQDGLCIAHSTPTRATAATMPPT